MQIQHHTSQPFTPSATKLVARPSKTEMGFKEILNNTVDIINPLQHIPVISDAYQALTGDKQSHLASIAGGGLYGGIIGATTSLGNTVLKEITGESILGNAVNVITSQPEPSHITAISHASLQPDAGLTNNTDQSTLFYSLTTTNYEQKLSALGLENEHVRQQYLGKLDEQAKDLL
jgi:hypothetical protein